jgi:hypothetical protein
MTHHLCAAAFPYAPQVIESVRFIRKCPLKSGKLAHTSPGAITDRVCGLALTLIPNSQSKASNITLI